MPNGISAIAQITAMLWLRCPGYYVASPVVHCSLHPPTRSPLLTPTTWSTPPSTETIIH